jgi:hypothetical protein
MGRLPVTCLYPNGLQSLAKPRNIRVSGLWAGQARQRRSRMEAGRRCGSSRAWPRPARCDDAGRSRPQRRITVTGSRRGIADAHAWARCAVTTSTQLTLWGRGDKPGSANVAQEALSDVASAKGPLNKVRNWKLPHLALLPIVNALLIY